MFVNVVSVRRRRGSVAADIEEAAEALDTLGTGNIIFATLIDDPADVVDTVDAFTGETLYEAASASDTCDVASGIAALIDEPAAATDTVSVREPATVAADVAETATADSTQDGATASAFATWDPVNSTSVTLSGGNLTATSTGFGNARSTPSPSSGKYYYEVTIGTWSSGNTGPSYGIAAASVPATGIAGLSKDGNVWVDFSPSGNLGSRSSGDTIGVAIDVTAQLIWFRVAPAGNWNGSGTANPATGTGGRSISSLSGTLRPSAALATVGDTATANFGGSAFSGTVPSGFAAGF